MHFLTQNPNIYIHLKFMSLSQDKKRASGGAIAQAVSRRPPTAGSIPDQVKWDLWCAKWQ
jgi:hypothetical protein